MIKKPMIANHAKMMAPENDGSSALPMVDSRAADGYS